MGWLMFMYRRTLPMTENVLFQCVGIGEVSHLAPTILMNMLNPQRPRIHDADYGMSVHRELNEAVLVEGSVNTPGALYRHDHRASRFRLVIIGYVADPHLPTASHYPAGSYTSSDVFLREPAISIPQGVRFHRLWRCMLRCFVRSLVMEKSAR
ncbi:hypothetical protein BS47DRAFT_1394847 [Hydnum rufescens UP504]|uniref:Uncharacterized protein n=1 Tax=Hydnum rufescens UP504 TaxID=1448309 RepID=A0A9P6ATN3_9AGAM|nr:hypothetical protein BS47DRAFT_1394847 [Hydnum rufescens UP504]